MSEQSRRPDPGSIAPHASIARDAVFARDQWHCVYCGAEGTPETLSVDHVQPRVRGGDHSAGNVVTACLACNARKAHRSHVEFLLSEPEAWRNFSERARYVWPRHFTAVNEELERRARKRPNAKGAQFGRRSE